MVAARIILIVGLFLAGVQSASAAEVSVTVSGSGSIRTHTEAVSTADGGDARAERAVRNIQNQVHVTVGEETVMHSYEEEGVEVSISIANTADTGDASAHTATNDVDIVPHSTTTAPKEAQSEQEEVQGSFVGNLWERIISLFRWW